MEMEHKSSPKKQITASLLGKSFSFIRNSNRNTNTTTILDMKIDFPEPEFS